MADAAIFVTNGFNGGFSAGIRGDSFSDFQKNCRDIYGDDEGDKFAIEVMEGLRKAVLGGGPNAAQAKGTISGNLGGVEVRYEGQQAPVNTQPPSAGAGPTCDHGAMKYVAAGVSKSTNKPYAAFWACQAPRGQQCPSKRV